MRFVFCFLFIYCSIIVCLSQAFDFRQTVVYQIYPRSFQDSNNDGIGDLRGIISKLDYLKEMGVETLWISPFFESPQADFGYDIKHFRKIAPEYGTLETVDSLISEVHQRGMRIIFDMVMNHTSDQHPWFKASSQPENNEYSDFYVWAKGRGKNGKRPPNNWKSMIGGKGWQYHPEKGMWYWACFLPFQPDLNYRNPAVRDSMFNNVKFWLDRGVDGFRLDIFNAIFEDKDQTNNPFSFRAIPNEKNVNGFFQQQKFNLNHSDNEALAVELRTLIDSYPDKFLVGEVFGNMNQLKSYLGPKSDGLNLVFLFESLSTPLKAKHFIHLIETYETNFSNPNLPTWVFGNHDRMRRRSVLGGDLEECKLSASLQLTLRGVPFIYYGEEIGMEQARIPSKQALDPLGKKYSFIPSFVVRWTGNTFNRDECRTPMQWNNSNNAGFSKSKPWLPIHSNFEKINVATQIDDSSSLLFHYQQLLAIRNTYKSLSSGKLTIDHKNSNPNILAYYRELGDEKLWIVHNFARKPKSILAPSGLTIFNGVQTSNPQSTTKIPAFGTRIIRVSEKLH